MALIMSDILLVLDPVINEQRNFEPPDTYVNSGHHIRMQNVFFMLEAFSLKSFVILFVTKCRNKLSRPNYAMIYYDKIIISAAAGCLISHIDYCI